MGKVATSQATELGLLATGSGGLMSMDETNIQGNITVGFNKDHQKLLFFQFPHNPDRVRRWLHYMHQWVATADEVRRFNELFKAVNSRGGERGVLKAVWTQLLVSGSGLRKLGVAEEEVAHLDEAFAAGMRQRRDRLGDTGQSDPSNWEEPFRDHEVDVVLIVAGDDDHELRRETDRLKRRAITHGLILFWEQEGHTLPEPLTGHEHFGFKDGMSQPIIQNSGDVPAGHPRAVPVGDFVLGHTDSSGSVRNVPTWARDGSLAVVRRLRQDVQAFREFVESRGPESGLTPEALGAKLMGRWKSGTPIDKAPDADDPSIARDDVARNAFAYSDDPEGQRTPRFAHIRKVFPRDQEPPGDESHRKRIMRRGIPYGYVLPSEPTQSQIERDRGLVFVCFQSSIIDQFELIQQHWSNDPNFPVSAQQPTGGYAPTPGQPADGPDPIVGQHHGAGVVNLKRAGVADTSLRLADFVRTTAGEYLFAPSLASIQAWSKE